MSLKPDEGDLRDRFVKSMKKIAGAGGKPSELEPMQEFMEDLKAVKKSPIERASFLSSFILRNPILWEDVCTKIWTKKEEREANKFPFLQGDLIETSMPTAPGIVRSDTNHNLWIVVSKSCEATRAPYIEVGPIFPILERYANSTGDEKDLYDKFGIGLRFGLTRRFSLPSTPDHYKNEIGFLCDFETPYFLEREYVPLAKPIASLTLDGWYLFTAVLRERISKVPLADEKLLRA